MTGFLLRCNPAAGEFQADGVDADGLLLAGEDAQVITAEGVCESPPGVAAAARWNLNARRLELIRDRTGLHPLFYSEADDGSIAVATDLRRLARVVGARPDPEAVGTWLDGGSLHPAQTLLSGIARVPAGHVVTADPNGSKLRQTWKPPTPGTFSLRDAARFGQELEKAVARLSAFGRPAVFLSGGVDSACVAAAATNPLALCVEFPGASERVTQEAVTSDLGLETLEATADHGPELIRRAAERARTSLWPTPALWAPIFDHLAGRAREAGASVLLDGIGGDELLDAGYAAGRELRLHPLALISWLDAERRYTGSLAASARRLVRPPATRFATERAADLVSAELAAQREETFDHGVRTGLPRRHPLWDSRVVELLHGLPPAALVAHRHPKSPARRYLLRRVPSVRGAWPRPQVADVLVTAVERDLQRLVASEGLPRLEALGMAPEQAPSAGLPLGRIWRMLCVEYWLAGVESWGER